MWLQYGINEDGDLVEIEKAPRGKTNLRCPYCEGALIAKKGLIKHPHFAHDGATCRAVGKRKEVDAPTLPLYDRFGVELTATELDILKRLADKEDFSPEVLEPLDKKGVVYYSPYIKCHSGYGLTNQGLIVLGRMPLAKFFPFQRGSITLKHLKFAEAFSDAHEARSSTLHERRIDLQIYRVQIKRLLNQNLYFLEIVVDGQKLHKIGVTTRPIEQRVEEVKQDLRPYYQIIAVKVLGVWERWGCVEKYFKYRYSEFNHPIGALTEYFKFDRVASVMKDLRALGERFLDDWELDILDDKPSQTEERVNRQLRLQA